MIERHDHGTPAGIGVVLLAMVLGLAIFVAHLNERIARLETCLTSPPYQVCQEHKP